MDEKKYIRNPNRQCKINIPVFRLREWEFWPLASTNRFIGDYSFYFPVISRLTWTFGAFRVEHLQRGLSVEFYYAILIESSRMPLINVNEKREKTCSSTKNTIISNWVWHFHGRQIFMFPAFVPHIFFFVSYFSCHLVCFGSQHFACRIFCS